ncbi:TetR/AcrR family transcriptional regulator [bacterium]|nr:TetR/AcrR family transcriptional regulator [bacterium]
MERTEKEYVMREQKIIKSARKLFIRFGFDNVSLNQIAKDAEFGKSTLYYYFKSKDELFYHVIRSFDIVRLRSCQNEFNKGEYPQQKISNYLVEYYRFAKKDYVFYMMSYDYEFLLYRKIIPNLATELIEKYEKYFVDDACQLKNQLLLGEETGHFKTMEDKDFLLGYIMSTTRGFIFFIFQHLFVTKTISEKKADEYYNLHLKTILNNL